LFVIILFLWFEIAVLSHLNYKKSYIEINTGCSKAIVSQDRSFCRQCILNLRFSLSYRDVEELLQIRGVKVDHATIQRWVFKFAPMIESQFLKRKKAVCTSWRMDETYIKVKRIWKYLYRAVDKEGNTVDFLLTNRRKRMSAQSFLIKAIGNNGIPAMINIDKSGANIPAHSRYQGI
jgi:putative transposase